MKKIGIIICTYKRKDGKTPFYLNRTLESIKNQTYKNYKIFLIGDRYEDDKEFNSFFEGFTNDTMYLENLPIAYERDLYGENKKALWSYAGTYATNYGIDLCVKEGIDYVSFINHDDEWFPEHLEEITKCIEEKNADFICTLSTYRSPNNFLPKVQVKDKYIFFYPAFARLIHSSVCINFKKIPLRHVDVFKETGNVGLPGDGELWERMRTFLQENKLNSILINKLTCRHDEEGYELK
jgi:glycosyltransferase involved in cell wall biosynthesis